MQHISIIGIAIATLVAGPAALAAAPHASATTNCALALASRLHARLGALERQPNFNTVIATDGEVRDQIIERAELPGSDRSVTMVCTYDAQGKVLSLRRSGPLHTALIGSFVEPSSP